MIAEPRDLSGKRIDWIALVKWINILGSAEAEPFYSCIAIER